MNNQFERTALLLGDEALNVLKDKKVLVFGVGGVGGYVCEALARSGVGNIDLVDNDIICESNINRQIVALSSTLGRYKVDVMKDRILDINSKCNVNVYKKFYLPENSCEFDVTKYDYIVDAIDTVTAKIDLVVKADKANTKIISSMGAGNKLDPTKFEVTDIHKTSICPLARVMRKELKDRKIKKLKVVYSKEVAIKPRQYDGETNKRQTPGSIAFVPSVAGLIVAGEVIKDLLKFC